MNFVKKSKEKISDLKKAIDLVTKIKSYSLNSSNYSKLDKLDDDLFSILLKYHLDYYITQDDLKEMIAAEEEKIAPYINTLQLLQEVKP